MSIDKHVEESHGHGGHGGHGGNKDYLTPIAVGIGAVVGGALTGGIGGAAIGAIGGYVVGEAVQYKAGH
mgnify:FL=1